MAQIPPPQERLVDPYFDKVREANVAQGVAGSALNVPMAMRDKVWPERTDAEKMQALREQVVYLTHRIESAARTIESLRYHQHGPTGMVAVPLDHGGESHGYRDRMPMSLRDPERG